MGNSNSTDNSFDFSNFDKIKEYENKHFWYILRKKIIHFFVTKYLPIDAYGIELGAGIGQNAVYLEQQGIKIDCAEYYGDAVEYIKNSGFKGSVKQLNLLDPNQEIGKYQFYGLFDVLEHFDEPEKILTNIYKQIPTSSYIFATVPAYRFLWSKKDHDVGHKNRYYKYEFEEVFKKSNFKVIDSTYIFSYLFLPLLISRMLGFDKQSEYKIKSISNVVMITLGAIELLLFKIGVRFPFGGSVLIVAQK